MCDRLTHCPDGDDDRIHMLIVLCKIDVVICMINFNMAAIYPPGYNTSYFTTKGALNVCG